MRAGAGGGGQTEVASDDLTGAEDTEGVPAQLATIMGKITITNKNLRETRDIDLGIIISFTDNNVTTEKAFKNKLCKM